MIKDKFSFYFFLAIPLIIALYVGFLWGTYIDESINEGEAYGFVIGEGKKEVYERAKDNFKDRSISVWIKVPASFSNQLGVRPGTSLLLPFGFQNKGFLELEPKNRWEFYFDNNFFDSIHFNFLDGKLVEVYRHRKYFELP